MCSAWIIRFPREIPDDELWSSETHLYARDLFDKYLDIQYNPTDYLDIKLIPAKNRQEGG